MGVGKGHFTALLKADSGYKNLVGGCSRLEEINEKLKSLIEIFSEVHGNVIEEYKTELNNVSLDLYNEISSAQYKVSILRKRAAEFDAILNPLVEKAEKHEDYEEPVTVDTAITNSTTSTTTEKKYDSVGIDGDGNIIVYISVVKTTTITTYDEKGNITGQGTTVSAPEIIELPPIVL